jgi:hypothetical protein
MNKLLISKFLAIVSIYIISYSAMAYDAKPVDVYPTCIITNEEFNQWKDTTGTYQGDAFNAADSLQFDDETACNFYKWSWQMFLWLTTKETAGKHVFDGKLFFDVDASTGEVFTDRDTQSVRTEKFASTEQAGSKRGVLMAQPTTIGQKDGSLVYYSININDVFNAQAKQTATGKLSESDFPTDHADLNRIAAAAGVLSFPDGHALAMEIKTSWIKVDDIDKFKDHLTVTGSIPLYVQGNNIWTWDGKSTEDVMLAMVGMHVVGSLKGHPELMWASFEQKNNAPNAPYYYADKLRHTRTVVTNIQEQIYSFNDSENTDSNVQRMKQCGTTEIPAGSVACIIAEENQSIGPSNIVHTNPWGSAPADISLTDVPSLPDGEHPCNSTAGLTALQKILCNNTDILSANASVIAKLPSEDVRNHYELIGGVWTGNGSIPIFSDDTDGNNPKFNKEFRGSFSLANSTLETFNQDDNCFSCHAVSSKDDPGTNVSHIFSNIVDKYKSDENMVLSLLNTIKRKFGFN